MTRIILGTRKCLKRPTFPSHPSILPFLSFSRLVIIEDCMMDHFLLDPPSLSQVWTFIDSPKSLKLTYYQSENLRFWSWFSLPTTSLLRSDEGKKVINLRGFCEPHSLLMMNLGWESQSISKFSNPPPMKRAYIMRPCLIPCSVILDTDLIRLAWVMHWPRIHLSPYTHPPMRFAFHLSPLLHKLERETHL